MSVARGYGLRTAMQAAVATLLIYLNLAVLGIREALDLLTATALLQLRPLQVVTTAVPGFVLHATTGLVLWILIGSVLVRTPRAEQGALAVRYVAGALVALPVSFVGGWFLFAEPVRGLAGVGTVMTGAALVVCCWPIGVCFYVWSRWKRNLVREE